MNQNDRVKQASRMIIEMLDAGYSEPKIAYKLLLEHGYGDKFLKNVVQKRQEAINDT